ncbi:MAG: Fic family protein [bacterium]|nr:Fic family protein [bacterium]
MTISSREQKIITILLEQGSLQSSSIHEMLAKRGEDISLVTVKRALSDMAVRGILLASGSGRSSSYQVSVLGRIYADIDARAYCAIEPDRRYGLKRYNQDLFAGIPDTIFSPLELKKLEDATVEYTRRTTDLPPAIEKRELERLVIELSWKSSKIEGNTYSLLDTEKLILENKEAPGHAHSEAQMILNHKDAFNFVRENTSFFQTLSQAHIEELHAILIKDLEVGHGLRERVVGIVGSVYQPLDNVHQVREGLTALTAAVERVQTPYAKAIVALLGISYLQPFEDGNKRTSRLLANAILLSYACAPLSYRSVEESEYREALLVFYELNSIVPFKKIFIDQYDFAARTYAVK